MNAALYVLRRTARLVWERKVYFLVPIILAVLLLSLLAYKLGPAVSISFVYTGL